MNVLVAVVRHSQRHLPRCLLECIGWGFLNTAKGMSWLGVVVKHGQTCLPRSFVNVLVAGC